MVKPPSPQEFDEKENLIRLPVYGTGYHTRLRPPATAHATRESGDHAIRCLASDDPADQKTGRRILSRLLSLQVADPTAKHFGIWGWFAEEPPQEMDPADWNWADFIGVRLLEILHDYGDRLTPELRDRTRAAIDHAAWSIFRRNVGPEYTNICAMGAVVCIAWAEMMPEPRLLDYGLRRLKNMRRELEFHEGYPEYNSPNYGMVVLVELERLLHLVTNPEARAEAKAILEKTWQLIADQFHPGTGQWAGPQSRSYQDWLSAEQVDFLETRIGMRIVLHASSQPIPIKSVVGLEHLFPCPEAIRVRFAKLPASPHEHRQCWVKQKDGTPAVISTTWFTDEATLGSMNREMFWIQRRVVLGFWRTPEDTAARVRLRMLHNGTDFTSGFAWNQQEGPRILTGFHILAEDGDFHPHFYFPEGGTFRTRDLRIRYEVEGVGARVSELKPGVFELRAGTHKVVVHTGPIRFNGKLVTNWTCGNDGHLVWVEGIFYSGEERPFHPVKTGESSAAAALELLRSGENPSTHRIVEKERDGYRFFHWQANQAHEVRVPQKAIKRPAP